MAEVLNMVPKKEVFEGIISGQRTDIPIKKNDWWKKRLMDQDTGRFKDFAVVCISCGSSDKYYYAIQSMELKDDLFIITISQDLNNIDDGDSDEDTIEQDVEQQANNPEDTLVENDVQEEQLPSQSDSMVVKEPIQANGKPDVRHLIVMSLNKFCNMKDVYVVNASNVTIRNNGQILGCNRRLIADRDADVKFNFEKKEFIQYDGLSADRIEYLQNIGISDTTFVAEINSYFNKLLKNSYVFINKNACGFRMSTNGDLVFMIYAVSKKKYLFKR